LNQYVWDALGLERADGASPAAMRLVEMAVADARPVWGQPENPLLAARYLLAIGELPAELTETVPDAATNSPMSVRDLIARLPAARAIHLDFQQIKNQRQALATSTSARFVGRTNWGPQGKGTETAAEAVLARIDELLNDEVLLGDLRAIELRERERPRNLGPADLAPTLLRVEPDAQPPSVQRPRITKRQLITISLAGTILAIVAAVGGSTMLGNADSATASSPIKVKVLTYTGSGPVVRADAVREGQQAINVDGCSDVSEFPKSWDALGHDQEVLLNVTPRRDDVVLVGFSVTEVRHFDRGERVGILGMCGGNGAISGFTVADDAGGPTIKAFGPGAQPDGKMRLRLSPEALKLDGNASYKLAVHFVGDKDRISVWKGDFIFRYGTDGGKTFRYTVGPARTIGEIRELPYFQNDNGLWTRSAAP
jgi:hypothetical protein